MQFVRSGRKPVAGAGCDGIARAAFTVSAAPRCSVGKVRWTGDAHVAVGSATERGDGGLGVTWTTQHTSRPQGHHEHGGRRPSCRQRHLDNGVARASSSLFPAVPRHCGCTRCSVVFRSKGTLSCISPKTPLKSTTVTCSVSVYPVTVSVLYVCVYTGYSCT